MFVHLETTDGVTISFHFISFHFIYNGLVHKWLLRPNHIWTSHKRSGISARRLTLLSRHQRPQSHLIHAPHDVLVGLVDGDEQLGLCGQLPLDVGRAEHRAQVQPGALARQPLVLRGAADGVSECPEQDTVRPSMAGVMGFRITLKVHAKLPERPLRDVTWL